MDVASAASAALPRTVALQFLLAARPFPDGIGPDFTPTHRHEVAQSRGGGVAVGIEQQPVARVLGNGEVALLQR